MRALSVVALLGCSCSADPAPLGPLAAGPPPSSKVVAEPSMAETDGDPFWEVEVRLADGARLVQGAEGLAVDGRVVVDDPLGPVAVDRRAARFVVAARVDGGPDSRVLACAPPAPCRAITDGGSPDRVAISPDGQLVAWVASVDGLPAVFVAPFDRGPATQLTNVGLEPASEGPPVGFVAPPHLGPPRFEAGALAWESPDGPIAVELR